jgi:energy-coupling factor transporter transmembrane protein EcfT
LPIIGTLAFTYEGIKHGFLVSLKILTAINASLITIYTTSQEKIIAALQAFKVPYFLTIMVTTALSFIPIFLEELKARIRALQNRGLAQDSLLKKIRTIHILLVSMTICVVKRAHKRAIAMEARGFDFKNKIRFDSGKIEAKDAGFLLIMLSFPFIGLLL